MQITAKRKQSYNFDDHYLLWQELDVLLENIQGRLCLLYRNYYIMITLCISV